MTGRHVIHTGVYDPVLAGTGGDLSLNFTLLSDGADGALMPLSESLPDGTSLALHAYGPPPQEDPLPFNSREGQTTPATNGNLLTPLLVPTSTRSEAAGADSRRSVSILAPLMVIFKAGPAALYEPFMLEFLWKALVIPVGILVPIGAIFMPLLVNYGLVELVGTLTQPFMRSLSSLSRQNSQLPRPRLPYLVSSRSSSL